MFRRILQRVGVVIAVTLGALVIGAVPAHAAWDDCPSGLICFWDGPNGGSAMATRSATIGCWNAPRNDWAGSVWNRSSRIVVLYEHAGCPTTNGWFEPLASGWRITFGLSSSNELTSYRVS